MTLSRVFFSLLLVTLPTQLGYHIWPDWAMVLGRRVDYLAPTIFLTDLLIFLTVGCWLASRVIQWVRENPKSQFSIFKQILRFKVKMFKIKHLWTVVVIVFVVANIFLAHNTPVAIYKWLKVGEFLLLGWYIVTTKPPVSFIVIPLSIGILSSSLFAIVQFVLQRSIGGPLWWLGERTFTIDTPGIARIPLDWSLGFGHWDFGLKLRPYATFPHPNVLGGFLAVVLPLVIYNLQIYKSTNLQMNETSKKILQWGVVVTIVSGIVALLLTFSRSAIVVGGVAIAIVLLSRHSRESGNPWVMKIAKRWIPGPSGSAGRKARNEKGHLFLFLGAAIIFSLITYHLSLITSNEESVVVRQQLNDAAIKLWASAPLFGVGLGNFLVRLPEALPTRTIYFLQPVHNIYLLVLAETGVVGGSAAMWLLWLLVKSKTSQEQNESRAKRMARSSFLLVPLLTLLLLGLFDHYPLTLQQGQLLLTLFIALTIIRHSHDSFASS